MGNPLGILLVAAAVVGVALLVWLVADTRRRMRAGGTPPGPPSNVDLGAHDEPDTDYGRLADQKRHLPRSSEDVSKAARDEERLLGR